MEDRSQVRLRARRRLVGAVVLLLCAALVLPWLLDTTPRPPVVQAKKGQEPVMGMPVVVLSPSAPMPGQPMPAPKSSIVSTHTTPALLATVPQHSVLTSVAEGGKNNTNLANVSKINPGMLPAGSSNSVQATAHQEIKMHPAVLPASVDAVQQPTNVEPLGAKHSHPSPVAAQNMDFVVQLGVFSSAENVQQLRKRLQAVGIDSYTERLSSGATRVRSGPYMHRTEVDRVLATLRLADIQAQIVPVSH